MVPWRKVSQIKASPHKKEIFCQLVHFSPKTPSELRDLTNIALSHVSKNLKDLVDLGLVECLTPNVRRGKLYTITDEGLEISPYLDCH